MTDIVERLFKERNAAIREIGEWAARYGKAEAEIERLREALGEAIDEVEAWASYASPYFREKHDLYGVLTKLRAALGEDK